MKNLIAAAVFGMVAFSVAAKPIAFNFSKVDLNKFLDATYGEVLHKNYVQTPELMAQGKKVSVRISVEESELSPFLIGFLDQLGVEQRETGGVIYLAPKSLAAPQALQVSSPPAMPVDLNSPLPVAFGGLQPVSTALLVRKDYEVYTPVARTGEFICAFVGAMFSPGACHVSGPVVVLKLDTEDMDKLHPLLEKIDTVAGRVKINATFVEVTSTGRDGFGMSVLANVLGSQLGVTLGTPSSAASISLKGTNFSAVIDAIKRDSRFKQIAAPSGAVYSGERFSIVTGEDVPTLGDIQLDNKGNTSQAVVYRPSGVILDVVPRVVRGPNGSRVEAVIKAQVSSFVATTNGVNGSPTLSKREVQTVQLLDDGEVVVLGGLNTSKTTNSTATFFGLPFGHGHQADSTELLLILTASVDR